ncbi:MAG: 4'-phosphopantetheinyl transferase superfamily protein [Ruminococcaceae bacterium]|nr:4'-phosphopantetheinyl transferase superfamily protein [Oscillospiraceae bacterium]
MFTLYYSCFNDEKQLRENKNNVKYIALSHFRFKMENSITADGFSKSGDISVINISPYSGIDLSSEGRKLANNANNRIVYGKYGKPFLADGKFSFSVSHSGKYNIVAACADNIGIDIQLYGDKPRDYMKIAQRWFNDRENALLKAMPDYNREEMFYEIWSRKEAYVKFTGTGISGIKDISTVKNGELCDKMPNGQFISMEKTLSPLFREEKFKAKIFI